MHRIRCGTPPRGTLPGEARLHAWALARLLSALALLAAALPCGAAAALELGALTLHPCPARGFWCGSLERPLDPTHPRGEHIGIAFEVHLHTAPGPARGLLVGAEGGPGFPSTGEREAYLTLLGPLSARYDLLLMDYRGTGHSAAVNCPALEHAPKLTVEAIGACGESLGPKAGLYGTGLAADDLSALLQALAAPRIDLYGNSYGTFFAQTFVLRHPDQVRTVILDGAYPLDGPDEAWYPHYAPAVRLKFERACARDPLCAQQPGRTLERIGAALNRLRRAPFAARAPDADGTQRDFTADGTALAVVMFGSAPARGSVRELDAAARAFTAGDRAPLLRLMAESVAGVESREPEPQVTRYSAGLAAAVMCTDAPQVFDMSLPPPARRADRDRRIAARERSHPDAYAPFTFAEFRGMPPDYAFLDQCIAWPVTHSPALPLVPPGRPYPDLPVLVISGDLDSMTPIADAQQVVQRFPRAQHLVIVNGFHVNALRGRSDCAARVVRSFIATLGPGDTRCASAGPPLPLVPVFARRSAELAPLRNTGGSAEPQRLRIAHAALLTAGDVLIRLESNTSGHGLGLRGGEFTVTDAPAGRLIRLHGLRWTDDVSVSGELRLGAAGSVAGALEVAAANGVRGVLQLARPAGSAEIAGSAETAGPAGPVRIEGVLGGQRIRAEAPAFT